MNKKSALTYLGSSHLPLPTSRDVWPECLIIKDSFWEKADKTPTDVVPSFEHMEEDDGKEVYIYENLKNLNSLINELSRCLKAYG